MEEVLNGDTGLVARTKINNNFTSISAPTIIRDDQNRTIIAAGIYVFYGSTPRTWTINNGIVGSVEIRTLSTAKLTLSGNINPAFGGGMYSGTTAMVLRWDSGLSLYSY